MNPTSEPVRVYIYSVAVAVLVGLSVLGYIDAETKDVVLSVLGAVLVVAGAETARSKVTPV